MVSCFAGRDSKLTPASQGLTLEITKIRASLGPRADLMGWRWVDLDFDNSSPAACGCDALRSIFLAGMAMRGRLKTRMLAVLGLALFPGCGGTAEDRCSPMLLAVVRDFDSAHPDFENPDFLEPLFTVTAYVPFTGLVEEELVDGAPRLASVYSDDGWQMITSAESFATWFATDSPVRRTYDIDLDGGTLEKSESNGFINYRSDAFFPIDGVASTEPGFFDDEGVEHNFHFTLELHARFIYQGGEQLTFVGDDDIWLFVDNRLVLDVGGLHQSIGGTVNIDDLDLTLGAEYPLAMFYAERHTGGSHFSLTTSLDFSNCGPASRP